MVAVRKPPYVSPQEYLKRERTAEIKSEYFDGRVYAMAGASRTHNRISLDTATVLNTRLRDSACEVFAGDMRVRIVPNGPYVYPDVVVVCGKAEFEDAEFDTLINPTVVIEVLSESTESYDRGRKFASYQQLESLQEYVLISQDAPRVECFTRQPDSRWLLSIETSLDASLPLDSIGCALPLSEVYARVKFSAEESPG